MKLESMNYLARILNIQVAQAYALVRNGVIGPPVVVRVGRKLRVNPQELSKWIAGGGNSYPGGWRKAQLQGSA